MNKFEKISNFLTEAGVYFLATVDGDKPKCRPIGFHVLRNDRLYFGVGDFKDVYKQLCRNPEAEIVAVIGDTWLASTGRWFSRKRIPLPRRFLRKYRC